MVQILCLDLKVDKIIVLEEIATDTSGKNLYFSRTFFSLLNSNLAILQIYYLVDSNFSSSATMKHGSSKGMLSAAAQVLTKA